MEVARKKQERLKVDSQKRRLKTLIAGRLFTYRAKYRIDIIY